MNHRDVPRVSELLCACYRWLGRKENFTPQHVRFLVEHRGSINTVKRESEAETYCVACSDTEVVGVVSVRSNEITKLYVHPSWHRMGVGKLLFEKAEEIVVGSGYATVMLGTVGKSPVPFYESMGMTILERRPRRRAEERGGVVILMEKFLV